jgi:hypothetical protein
MRVDIIICDKLSLTNSRIPLPTQTWSRIKIMNIRKHQIGIVSNLRQQMNRYL